jgi:hypothetical protein
MQPSLRSPHLRPPLSLGRALQRHPQGKVLTTQHTRKGDFVDAYEALTLRVNGEDAAEDEEDEEVEVMVAPIRTITHTHEKMDNNKTISRKAANMPAQSSASIAMKTGTKLISVKQKKGRRTLSGESRKFQQEKRLWLYLFVIVSGYMGTQGLER